jgi:hypothetical protein
MVNMLKQKQNTISKTEGLDTEAMFILDGKEGRK